MSNRIVIIIQGGRVQAAYAGNPETHVIVIDRDTDGCAPEELTKLASHPSQGGGDHYDAITYDIDALYSPLFVQGIRRIVAARNGEI